MLTLVPTPAQVVDLSAWRSRPSRADRTERRIVVLTAEAWRHIEQMSEDAAVAARIAAAECDRELEAAGAALAEKDAEFFEGILRAIKEGVQ